MCERMNFMNILKQHKQYSLYGSFFCMMIYAVLFNKIVYHGGSFLPQEFHVPFWDISEYYAILNKLNAVFILLFMVMLALYVYVNRTVLSSIHLYLKVIFILSSLFLGIVLFGILAFLCEGASTFMIYGTVQLLSILFMQKGIVSVLFIVFLLIPLIHAVFHSHKSSCII